MQALYEYLRSDTDHARAIRDKFFPNKELLDVPVTEIGEVGYCYQNVRDHVQRRGGEETYGWLITIWPGKFIKALHHSVWRSPSGYLEDVTAPPSGRMTGSVTTFILDDETPIRTDGFDPSIPSRFIPLESSKLVADFINATQQWVLMKGDMIDFIVRERVPLEGTRGNTGVSSACPPHLKNQAMLKQEKLDYFAKLKMHYMKKLIEES